MNKRRWMFLVTFVVIFALGAGSSFLFIRKCAMNATAPKNDADALHSWAHAIGLTREQETKIEPMEKTLKKDLASIQSQLGEERMDLCRLMHADPVSREKLDQRLETICELEKKQQKRVVDHLLAMKTVMTPEQNDRFFQQMMNKLCPHCRGQGGKDHESCQWCRTKPADTTTATKK